HGVRKTVLAAGHRDRATAPRQLCSFSWSDEPRAAPFLQGKRFLQASEQPTFRIRERNMCAGDDRNCPDFELPHRKFKETLDRERRSFLRSSFAAAGGAAAMTAGGI